MNAGARIVSGLGCVACIAACGSSGASSPGDKPEVLVAFPENFRGYHSWESFDVTFDADLVGIHDGSKVTEYLNMRPAPGSTEFPVGTLIVKEATGGTIPHEIFAMVKRGGGYNAGAPGWEWFELQNLDNGKDQVKFVWRGFGPPKGELYGGDPNAGCNKCHSDCGNDAVCAKPLALSNF
jgi:hypothetical protein